MEEQMKSDEMEIDLVELFHTLVKKAWVILICLLVGAVIAGGYTKLFITPQYQASSTIYVLGNAGQSSNVSVSLSLSKQLTVDFTILSKSRPVMEKVIDKLGLDYSVEQLANMMTVENPTDSSILKVTVTNPDAQLARPVMEKVIDKLGLDYSVEQLANMMTVENPTDSSILKVTVTNPDAQLAADISNAMSDAIAERISEVMLTDKPSTVEEAVKPSYPVSPNVKRNILLGGILGAGLAAGVFVVLLLMDDTIKTEEDVKKYLHMNTIATISKEKKKKRAV